MKYDIFYGLFAPIAYNYCVIERISVFLHVYSKILLYGFRINLFFHDFHTKN
jgi:hypothetical protein